MSQFAVHGIDGRQHHALASDGTFGDPPAYRGLTRLPKADDQNQLRFSGQIDWADGGWRRGSLGDVQRRSIQIDRIDTVVELVRIDLHGLLLSAPSLSFLFRDGDVA